MPDNLQLLPSQSIHSKIRKNKKSYNNISDNEINDILKQYISANFSTSVKELFTPYQSQILFKKFKSEKLSKTDKEVFCRIIKPRLYAILNEQLNKIAQLIIYG